MNEYETYKTILELWEQGKSKEDIYRMTDISRYKIRMCLERFRSVSQLNEEAGFEKTHQIQKRVYSPPKRQSYQGKYSKEELAEAVESSYSIAETLRKLGIRPAGGNYATVKKRIREFGLDTSHFRGSGWAKGQRAVAVVKRPMKEILVKNSTYKKTPLLRKRLINEGYFEHRCGTCNLTEWLEQPIPLELHHKNGDRKDNRIENLVLLCPNCHALTDTYRGKNINVNNGTG